jgi:nucleotide-binding universal stress UspA family protein
MGSGAAKVMGEGRVVVCYDGTDAADQGIAAAAALRPQSCAIVLTAWKPIGELTTARAPDLPDAANSDERRQHAAVDTARRGARRARAAGLDAEPLAIRASGPLWAEVEQAAAACDAALIVCGTSRGGLLHAMSDSLPAALTHRAARPVMVVPSAEAADVRRAELQEWAEADARRRAPASP